MSVFATQATFFEVISAGIGSCVITTIDLASHSPFIRDDKDNGSVDFHLDGSIERKDMQKIAQAMPSLMKISFPLTSKDGVGIGYYKWTLAESATFTVLVIAIIKFSPMFLSMKAWLS